MNFVSNGKLGWTGIALAYGMTAMAMSYAFGPVSGGYFNPAITLALLIQRRLTAIKSVFYIAAQLLGAALAAAALSAVLNQYPGLNDSTPFLGACDLTDVGFKAATLLEAIGTFFLACALYGTLFCGKGSGSAAPFATGLAYTAGTLVFGPLTGAALNPARSFGPAIYTGHWSHAYVYWIGPITGAIAASWLYETLCIEKK